MLVQIDVARFCWRAYSSSYGMSSPKAGSRSQVVPITTSVDRAKTEGDGSRKTAENVSKMDGRMHVLSLKVAVAAFAEAVVDARSATSKAATVTLMEYTFAV